MKTLYEAHQNLKNKKISASELTQETLKVVNDSQSSSYLTVLEHQALSKAKKIDQEIKSKGIKHVLQGIPYNLKDLFVTKGIRTTAGSKILYNYVPAYDGHVSESLNFNEKAILLGKVSCDEFGMGSSNENTPYGPVKNPIDPTYVAGGSSGGSAASVAEGSAFFSIGTDTGGSIRLPANFCGVYGFKPSYGRVSRYGQIAYASSLDQAGPIARSSLDIAYIMEAITHKDPRDVTQSSHGTMVLGDSVASLNNSYLRGKKIAFDPSFIEGCEPLVKGELQKAMKALEKEGVEFVEVEFPHFKYAIACYYLIATSEASANLARYDGIHFGYRSKNKAESLIDTYINSRSEGFGEEVKRRIILGTFSLSSGYQDEFFMKACKVRRLIFEDFQKAFQKADMIFSPVSANCAFKRGDKVNDPLQMYLNDLYTIPVNLAGLPSMAIPFGKVGSLPTGFQLIGKTFADKEVIATSYAFEKATENSHGI